MEQYPRHRERSKVPVDVDFVYTVNGSASYYPYTCITDAEEIDDVVTKDYKALIAQGVIINNPCSYTKNTSFLQGTGSMTQLYLPTYNITLTGAVSKHLFQYVTGGSRCDPPTFSEWEAAIDIAKFYALANIDKTPYAFGEDTLELRETVEFLKHPLTGILKLSKQFRKDKRKLNSLRSIKAKLKALSQVTLEFQFAASPLYRSVVDALEAYSDSPATLPERLTARGKKVLEGATGDNPSFNSGGTIYTFERACNEGRTYRAAILYEITNPIRDWRYRLGFRAKDWPTTFWQVVPLSFMVDRMVDVSSFSKGVINLADPSVKILAASVTSKVARTYTGRCTGSTHAGWTCSGTGEVVVETEFGYHRTPWVPTFRDTLPKFDISGLVDSATKVVELAALITQQIK